MKVLVKLATLFIVAIIVFGSCTSQKELTYLSNLDTTSAEQFFPLDRPDYRIQFQDILYVNFFTMNEAMNKLLNPVTSTGNVSNMYRDESSSYIFGYTVSDDGNITLPIFGDIMVKGLTLPEVKSAIKNRAAEYQKDVTINVRLLSFKFTVIGEVNLPGTYTNFNNQLTVLEAIGMGGDITDYGDRKKVLVVRPTKEGTTTYRINLQDKNLLQSEGYFLLPNDIVIVEPLKGKPIQLNLPIIALIISTSISTITTTILLLSFINTTSGN